MSSKLKSTAVILSFLFAITSMQAKENIGSAGKVAVSLKAAAASCDPGTAQTDMDINNVRTTLLTDGDIWWNLSDAKYEVPKIDPPGSAPSVHSLFAGAIWLGGIDAGGQLKIAAQTYRQNGNDFWPGPLDDNASTESQVCSDYDKHWKVLGSDITDLLACYAANGGTCPQAQIPASILEWPAAGNPNARGANGNALTITQELAPFYDSDDNQQYDPTVGDYPVINPDCGNVYADEMIFWVYNDKGNIHTETGGLAIGVQVNALAFAFTTSDEVNDMTFYRYKLINKATNNIGQFYMAQWVDADLGCYNNDYVGCDTSRSLGICYNGTATDPDCATPGYGNTPPLIGIDYFEGPLSDLRPVITATDTSYEQVQLGMSAFTYYNNDFSVKGNPETAVHYYGYMTSRWKDNSPFTSDTKDGYGGSKPAKYMFPSDPPDGPFPQFWSECSVDNPPADRRFLQSSGPFTLEPGAVNSITVGAVWVRPEGVYPCPSFETIGVASDKAQALFDNCFKLVDGPDAPTLVIRELDKEIIIALANSPSSNNVGESYDEVDPVARSEAKNDPSITDTTYTFEGYMVYQLKNAQVSASELNDINKARLVAQVDIENGIDKLVNFTFDPTLGADVPELKVDGENKGIRKTFQVVEDLFATDAKALVNHKTYYFTAIAYAYNNYKEYDPLHPTEGGQKTPFLQGRRNYKIYSAIPHKWEPGRGGTALHTKYGDGVKITRIEGEGNGGQDLDLTDESIDNILNSPDHKYGPIQYVENAGPIDVKVYDPLKLKDAEFVFTMMDTAKPEQKQKIIVGEQDTTFCSDSAYWKLEIRDMSSGDFHEIYGERDIENANEQLIEDYGISIRLNQVELPGKAPDCWIPYCVPSSIEGFVEANGFIEGTMEFDDPEEPWLTGVKDDGTFTATNWIRSGQYRGPDGTGSNPPPEETFYDDHYYTVDNTDPNDTTHRAGAVFWDPNELYGHILDGTWAPYCLATNWINTKLDPGFRVPIPPYSFGPAFAWQYAGTYSSYKYFQLPVNRMDNLHSVDLVLTSDKDRWTHCVVIEEGEEKGLNEGGSEKGNIRMAHSWNKDGTYSQSDTGRSWFPGYAIDLETGEQLNIMFGENSWLVGENGRDMIWNPTSNEISPLFQPLFGGGHYVYIMRTKYDEGEKYQRDFLDNFNYTENVGLRRTRPHNAFAYEDIMWVSMAMLADGFSLDPAPPNGDIIPNDVKIRLRVNVPYAQYMVDGSNNGYPKYEFSTEGLGSDLNVTQVAKDACDMIRAVPNPYYAYSAYETSQLDNKIKITNLPDKCTISIYTLSGTLIRRFERNINQDTSEGASIGEKTNLDNSIEWDLKNNKNIPISSGLYLIHIKADGVCEKVVKWFGILRPIDLDSF